MISDKMVTALNGQVNAEMYSAYLYLAMNAYFEVEGYTGFAAWMRAQAQEEMFHAMKIYDFINERGGRAMLVAIDTPPANWDSPLAVFKASLAHEEKVTGLINGLVDVAIDLRDHASNSFLMWFVDEQVEEESNVGDIVLRLEQMADTPGAIYLLDKELGARVFTMPPAGE